MDIRQNIRNLAHNFCVTAGAGAGKTTCLRDTYIGLLEQGIAPSQIVAITFTEKAAEEMRTRVVQAVAARAQEDPSRDWHALLPLVEWAPLSTIHSFCVSLLREFGVLLGLDPDFAVNDENEFGALLDEMIQDVVRGRLSQGDQALRRLLAHYPSQLGGYMGQVYRSLRTDGLSPDQAKLMTRQAHEEQSKAGVGLVDRIETGVSELQNICAKKNINRQKPYGKNINELIAKWSEFDEALRDDTSNKAIIKKLQELTKGGWHAAKPARDIIRPTVDQLHSLSYLPQAAQLSDDLIGLVAEVYEQVEQECRKRSWLSFDDLLLMARDLIKNHPPVLAELRERWRVLMVDEFQDVNPVQGELVRLLAGLDDHDPVPLPPRLMVVGDRKQSIYAFRGADVTVFAKTMHEFPQLGGEVAALKENFRSQPKLIVFFNRLFKEVFRDAELAENAPRAYVDFNQNDEQVSGREHPQPELAAVELVQVAGPNADETEKLSASHWRQLEAVTVASYLGRLINQGNVPAGKIAIILRRLTQVGVYEDALRHAGIGFYTVRGRGFYDCQEVTDLLLAMSSLLNPQDNLSLAGFLRSPMVGLSDEALLALTYPDGQAFRKLAQSIEDAAPLPDWLGAEQSSRWLKALDLFQGLGPMVRRMSPAELIECLLDVTSIVPVLMAAPSGDQKAANLRKLLETARDPQGALKGGVEGFVRGLKAMVETLPEDPQAPLLGEDAQVVRLMSVHQAKGLEFPVVILPDLNAGRRGGDSLPQPRGGLVGLKPRDPLTNKLISTPVSKQLTDYHAAVQEAETARLFYVACTRAEERLVFIQTQVGREQSKRKGWSKWVEEIVRHDPETRIVTSAELGDPPTVAGQGLALAWPECIPPEPGEMDSEGAAIVKRVLEPEPLALLENRVVRISVSGVENFFACPRLSIYTRNFGLDTAALSQRNARNSGAPRAEPHLDPVALGSAVHKALELADLSAGPEGLEPALAALQPDMAAAVHRLASGIWDTRLVQFMSNLPSSHFLKEQPFRLWLEPTPGAPGVEVMGELDFLIIRPDPEPPIIVDYKVTPHIDPEHYRDQLGLYALALWSGNPDGPPPRTCLCYLREAGAKLVELKFSPTELNAYRDKIIQAATEMASWPPDIRPSDLPPGRDCAHCVLAGHGYCPDMGPEAE